ncbi:hypothetical protein ES332_A02G097500v1 [Gossypium tomentosum]|uniref:GRF-type domain-containing protein n=1 Tax=Gossypium tomentosum TaxID=34277 RepID=A0A5D2RIV9_GOSTO|nr:hypothetical protein ES332_A02G097500v1 [Gossypium tomentosum]
MDSHSSNSQPKVWVTYGSKKKSSYANVVTSSRKEYAYDRPAVKCHCNKLAPRDTSWSDLNPGRRFYGCSDFRDGGCDFFKWYDGKKCDREIELLRQLRDSERNLLKDNLALRKNAMDLVAFDGNHNGGSSAVDIEVEEGRPICGVEEEVALRKKMLTMKQKIKVIKKEKSMYKMLFSCSMLCIVCITIGFFFGSTGKRHMQLAIANVD